jgi:hypothetical protein
LKSARPAGPAGPKIQAGVRARGGAGFNGGSGVAASSRDAFALVNSTLAASVAMVVWMAVEWAHTGTRPPFPPPRPAPPHRSSSPRAIQPRRTSLLVPGPHSLAARTSLP